MVTDFGKCLRAIRLNNQENAKDMAKKLKISPAYLSAIENGKRNIPRTLIDCLKVNYKLEMDEINVLRETSMTSTESMKIYLRDMDDGKKKIILALSENRVNDEAINKMCKILEKSIGGSRSKKNTLERD